MTHFSINKITQQNTHFPIKKHDPFWIKGLTSLNSIVIDWTWTNMMRRGTNLMRWEQEQQQHDENMTRTEIGTTRPLVMGFDFIDDDQYRFHGKGRKGEILLLCLGLVFFWVQVKRGKKMKEKILGFNFWWKDEGGKYSWGKFLGLIFYENMKGGNFFCTPAQMNWVILQLQL